MRKRIRKGWKKPTPEQRRKWYLKSEYGLKDGEWDKLFTSQGHACAICQTKSPGNKWGWCTDHDHESGRVRGILCHKCNTDMGGYDRVNRNPKAISYAEGFKRMLA